MSIIRTILLISLMSILIVIAGCGEKAPTYQLEPSTFRLQMQDAAPEGPFVRVVDIDVTPQNEFIIVDLDAPGVFRFASDGKFVNDIYGHGSGNYQGLCSATPVDSVLAVNTVGLVEFFNRDGRPLYRHFIRGRGDVQIAGDRKFVINRMYDSFRSGHCLETYDENGKLINAFRTPQCTQEGEEMMDFAFTGITPENEIVYIPAVKDSVFIFDFQGNSLKAGRLKTKFRPRKAEDGSPIVLMEDVYADRDGIFIVRINESVKKEGAVHFDLIEQYDFDLNHVASYTFEKPLTMTVHTDYYSPWYHRFCHKDNTFYFMISQPYEQFMAFTVNAQD